MTSGNQDPIMPTVSEVCVLDGAGYGACWSCPILECPLWQAPDPSSPESQAVARMAAQRLWDNRTVIGARGRSALVKVFGPVVDEGADVIAQTAVDLLSELADPEIQENLRVEMAAEAVVQGRLDGRTSVRLLRQTEAWLKRVGARLPSPEEEAELVRIEERAASEAAGAAYGIPHRTADVAAAVARLRGLTRKATAAYRADHAR